MSAQVDPSEAFKPLAAVILGQKHNPSIGTALAKVLEAASRGIGQLTRGDLGLPPGLTLPGDILATDGDLVMLPRNAASWRQVRATVESWHREQRLAVGSDDAIRAAVQAILPPAQVVAGGRVVFDNAQQRLAVAALVDARIGVLTGGPGTGKTTSAAALLAVRKRLDPGLGSRDVLLAAPTGKAACRLAETLVRAAGQLTLKDSEKEFLWSLLPLTLHKALEWTPLPPERGGPFRRGATLPLDARIILVDEASMMDLSLMAHLVRAIRPQSTLWLLGDSDQLESVETGGVLAELVARGASGTVPSEMMTCWSARIGCPALPIFTGSLHSRHEANPLPGIAVGLIHSFRAKDAPWVLDMAAIAKPGGHGTFADFSACCARWAADGHVHRHPQRSTFREACIAQWKDWSTTVSRWSSSACPSDSDLRDHLAAFQLLCVTNAQVERANRLGSALLWSAAPQRHVLALPHGCPVMITVNNHALDLSNGDVGVALGQKPGHLADVAIFPGHPPIPIVQLPEHQPAFALTIHKSQGSEWRHIAIDLPDDPGELIDRNLLYTAITRSSGSIDLCTEATASWEAVFAS